MKRFYFLLLILSSCFSPARESSTHTDSVGAGGYEDFSEVGPFTVKEEIRNQSIVLANKRKPLLDFLVLFYQPDTYTPRSTADSADVPQYIITDATVIENTFFADANHCEKRSILMTSRGDFVEKEYYDLLIVDEDTNGKLTLADKITFDGSEGQSSTLVAVTAEQLSPRPECKVLTVTSTTEGGDVNLRKREWVEYYVADGKSFRPVLKVETERTDIQDYEATQSDNQNSSSELREITVLETSSAGLFDIQVRYTNIQNGTTASEDIERYSFNGQEYQIR